MEDTVDIARSTLANELGCLPSELMVHGVEPVTWRDSSLGCPQPGMLYLQVLTPGFRITLVRNDEHYTLHTDRGRRVVRCAEPGSPLPDGGLD